jgi:hypothetical protein
MVWDAQPPGIAPTELDQCASTSGLVAAKAVEFPVQSVHHDGLVYSIGYRPVLVWYVSLKSPIHVTMALADKPEHSPDEVDSRSSMPGSVMPSPDHPPPRVRNTLACTAPELDSG